MITHLLTGEGIACKYSAHAHPSGHTWSKNPARVNCPDCLRLLAAAATAGPPPLLMHLLDAEGRVACRVLAPDSHCTRELDQTTCPACIEAPGRLTGLPRPAPGIAAVQVAENWEPIRRHVPGCACGLVTTYDDTYYRDPRCRNLDAEPAVPVADCTMLTGELVGLSVEQEIRARALLAASNFLIGNVEVDEAEDKALLYRTADELAGYIRDGSDRNPPDVLTAQLNLLGELRSRIAADLSSGTVLVNVQLALWRVEYHMQQLEDQITAPTPGDTP